MAIGELLGNAISNNIGDILSSSGRALLGVEDVIQKIANLDLQMTNKWELTLNRNPQLDVKNILSGSPLDILKNIGTSAISAVGAIGDGLITQLYVENVTIPSIQFEFEQAGNEKYVVGVTYPDEVSMTFIDDERGLVYRWLEEWSRAMAFKDPTTNRNSLQNKNNGYIFRDNQNYAKRNAVVTLKSVTGISDADTQNILTSAGNIVGDALGGSALGSLAGGVGSLLGRVASGGNILGFPKILLKGLCLKSKGDIELVQDEGENIKYDVTFSIDDIEVMILS